jgi:hypothetical protein
VGELVGSEHNANAMEMLKVYSVALLSLLAGAAVVHNIYRPDLRLPVDHSSPSSVKEGQGSQG